MSYLQNAKLIWGRGYSFTTKSFLRSRFLDVNRLQFYSSKISLRSKYFGNDCSSDISRIEIFLGIFLYPWHFPIHLILMLNLLLVTLFLLTQLILIFNFIFKFLKIIYPIAFRLLVTLTIIDAFSNRFKLIEFRNLFLSRTECITLILDLKFSHFKHYFYWNQSHFEYREPLIDY